MSKSSFVNWENAPIGKEAIIALFVFVSGLVGEGVYFYTRFLDLEKDMLGANTQIEELLSKHIANEEQEISKLVERVKFYEKEFNINPLSWRKKNK